MIFAMVVAESTSSASIDIPSAFVKSVINLGGSSSAPVTSIIFSRTVMPGTMNELRRSVVAAKHKLRAMGLRLAFLDCVAIVTMSLEDSSGNFIKIFVEQSQDKIHGHS